MPSDFRELIEKLGGLGKFAASIDVTYGAAQQMHRRNSVSPDYWDRLLVAASEAGIDVSYSDLVTMRGKRISDAALTREASAA